MVNIQAETGHNADTYAENSVHGERGQTVDTSTASTAEPIGGPVDGPGDERGHVHGLSTGGVGSENGIGKPNAGDQETLSTVSTDSGNRRLTAEEVLEVRRLVRSGMSPAIARAEVLGEDGLEGEG
jgi:hypothetical protein